MNRAEMDILQSEIVLDLLREGKSCKEGFHFRLLRKPGISRVVLTAPDGETVEDLPVGDVLRAISTFFYQVGRVTPTRSRTA